MDNFAKVLQASFIGFVVARFLRNTSRVVKALELYKECLILLNTIVLEEKQEFVNCCCTDIYTAMLEGYRLIYDYTSAIECCRNLLILFCRSGERAKEGKITLRLAFCFCQQSRYKEAKYFYEKALSIMVEIGDRKEEAFCYGCLATVLRFLCEYEKAKEYIQKALAIRKEVGDKYGEASDNGNLGLLFRSLGEYDKAEKYLRKALGIMIEIGDRQGEGWCYGNLGSVLKYLGEFDRAKECYHKALVIRKEVGDRQGEAADYGHLGGLFQFLGECTKAEEYLLKALEIRKEVGDKEGVTSDYENLGNVYESLGDYDRAEEYLQKSLAIREEIGDKLRVIWSCNQLGLMFHRLSRYDKAQEFYRKVLAMSKEIGARREEAVAYGNLGVIFLSFGEFDMAEEYLQKSIAIRKEIGDKDGEASCNANLAQCMFKYLEYGKAEEYLQRALTITKEIDVKISEARCYGNLGVLYLEIGEYAKAEEYFSKALTIRKELVDRHGEAADYGNLGTVFRCRGEFVKAKEYHTKALAMSKEVRDIGSEFRWHIQLLWDIVLEEKSNKQELFSNLLASVEKSEEMRSFLPENDQFKIYFLDEHVFPYQLLSAAFCVTGNPNEALCVVELGRARALADLMSAQYSIEKLISVNLQSMVGIKRIMKEERNCTCLHVSFFLHFVYLWILKANNPTLFRKIDVNDYFVSRERIKDAEKVFGNETFGRFHIFPQEHCEDRTFFPSFAIYPAHKSSQQDVISASRPVTIKKEENENRQADLSLAQCYQMIIAPVADALEGDEIIMVPDRSLYKVPFAALSDESGKPLSETFRIRVVPSLTILQLIQDCPADYHSQTGALIVGDPEVSEVFYKGCVEKLCPLPAARKEAEIIGRLLGVEPLLGQQATKQAVLQSIHSVALIHFAAHGNAERGEIALAPLPSTNEIPQEEDYLLTMADISQVQLRAKLVVLSCCHSARGQIRSEGVVGIARAFLGSGARSVLVALWALEDEATKHFMSRFYENLVRGESASESLHQTMKWMRSNGYSDVRQWAPFMLIGDNVTFDFGK